MSVNYKSMSQIMDYHHGLAPQAIDYHHGLAPQAIDYQKVLDMMTDVLNCADMFRRDENYFEKMHLCVEYWSTYGGKGIFSAALQMIETEYNTRESIYSISGKQRSVD